jgi:hypothetical protein
MKYYHVIALTVILLFINVEIIRSQNIKHIDITKPEFKEIKVNGEQNIFYRWDIYAYKYPKNVKGVDTRFTFKSKNIHIKCEKLTSNSGYICTCGSTPWKDCMAVYGKNGCYKKGGSSPEAQCDENISNEK